MEHVTSLLSVSRLVTSEAGQQERADEALAAIRSVIPYAAASLAVWDPITREHRTRANAGYPDTVARHLNGRFVEADELYRLMRTGDRRPLRWRDVGFDYRDRYSARSVFIPAGFNEGTSVLLHSHDNRYTGLLHISVENRGGISDDAVSSLGWLQTVLSPVVDDLSGWHQVVTHLAPSAAAMIFAPDANGCVDVPGHEWRWRERDREALVADLHRHQAAGSGGSDRYLWRNVAGRWLGVRLHASNGRRLAIVDDGYIPHRLTDREMEVVAGVAGGRSNQQLAREIRVSVRTVAKHVENILAKTATSSRTDLCALAMREGFIQLT